MASTERSLRAARASIRSDRHGRAVIHNRPLGLAMLGLIAACAGGDSPSAGDARAIDDSSPPAEGLNGGVDTFESCAIAGTCHVAESGDDASLGHLSTPFRTIGQCMRALKGRPGGACVVRGGTYRETVKVESGLTLKAYSDGGKPERVVLSGADSLAGLAFAEVRPNVWRAPKDLSAAARRFEPQLAVGGTVFVEARWPNVGGFGEILDRAKLRTAGGGTTATHVVDEGLPPSLVGAIVHANGGLKYGAHTGVVTSQSPGAFDYAPDVGSLPRIPSHMATNPGTTYFVAGSEALLDAESEWLYDDVEKTVTLWLPSGKTPAGEQLEVKMRDYALDLAGTVNAAVEDVELFMAAVHMDPSSKGNVLRGLLAAYVTHYLRNKSGPYDGAEFSTATASTGIEISGSGNTLADSSIRFSAGHGVSVFGSGHTIRNNRIEMTDYASVYAYGIFIAPDTVDNRIEHNTLRRTGRSGIGTTSGSGGALRGTVIAFNDISSFGLTTEDLGGIYISNIDGATPSSGPGITDYTRIEGNFVHDSHWVTSVASGSAGIYFDCASRGFVVTHNVVWNTGGTAIQFSTCGGPGGAQYMTVNNNTLGPGQSANVGVYAPSADGLSNTYLSNNVFVVEQTGICATGTCNPATDYGGGGMGNWRGDPGFAAGSWVLAPSSPAKGTAASIWTDNAFGVDWRCPSGKPGCAGPVAPSYGAINPGGYEFTTGSTLLGP